MINSYFYSVISNYRTAYTLGLIKKTRTVLNNGWMLEEYACSVEISTGRRPALTGHGKVLFWRVWLGYGGAW